MAERETEWLTDLQQELAASDPEYAASYERQKFALALIEVRHAKGLTQKQVAELMGVPQSRIGQIEGKPWTVSLDRINAYARALGAHFELVVPSSPQTDSHRYSARRSPQALARVVRESNSDKPRS